MYTKFRQSHLPDRSPFLEYLNPYHNPIAVQIGAILVLPLFKVVPGTGGQNMLYTPYEVDRRIGLVFEGIDRLTSQGSGVAKPAAAVEHKVLFQWCRWKSWRPFALRPQIFARGMDETTGECLNA